MKSAFSCFSLAVLTLLGTCAEGEVLLTVHADRVVGKIDPKIYSHFLEHIYHSVNGGIWGELVWNRSFEDKPGIGQWVEEGGELVQYGLEDDVRLVFGEVTWQDYEITLEAKKTGGQEGFLVMARVTDKENFYWLNLGGWDNRKHGLERGDTGKRQDVVGEPQLGTIETDRWYKVRLRCEGARIQAWLDERPVLDFTDGENPHLVGAAGLGTWGTTARFRNVRVVSTDGTVLFSGTPSPGGLGKSGSHWAAYGTGRCAVTLEGALNSESCLSISGADSGVWQDGFCVKGGETYRGSLWARGDCTGGFRVRLEADGRTLAEAVLPPPEPDWAEYAFTLTPAADCDNANLVIVAAGTCDYSLDQVSLMAGSVADTGGFRPDLLKAVEGLAPPVIRWPGGCFASAYRWKDGIGPQAQRRSYDRRMWDDREVNAFGTDEFIRFCRAVGAEPLIVVNAGSWDKPELREEYLKEVLDWMEYCNGAADTPWGAKRAQNGSPEPYNVKYWEIDNETWGMGAGAYIQLVRRFAPAMRAAWPDIKLAACGSGGMDLEWNKGMIAGCGEFIDYLSIHHYEDPNNFAEGPANYEQFFEETGRLIDANDNPNLRIFVSEWNVQSTDWRTGLYAGGLLNAFERKGYWVSMATPALFLRHISATDWDNAFINFDACGWFPAPNYVVMKLWHENYAPEQVMISSDCENLNVSATRTGKTVVLKVVNPGEEPEPLVVTLSGDRAVNASAQTVAPGALDARNTLAQPDAVHVAPLEAQVDESGRVRCELPAFSASVLRIERP